MKSPDEFEAPGVEPVFPEKRQAINYAQNRAWFRSGEIRILDSRGTLERNHCVQRGGSETVILPNAADRQAATFYLTCNVGGS